MKKLLRMTDSAIDWLKQNSYIEVPGKGVFQTIISRKDTYSASIVDTCMETKTTTHTLLT